MDQWITANKLTLNEGKTEFIIICSWHRVPSFKQGPLIKHSVPQKTYDEQLTWDKHNDDPSKTISKNIFLLRKRKSFVSKRKCRLP